MHLHNFNFADNGETFTKAVGLGLKRSKHITYLDMTSRSDFTSDDLPNNIAPWLFDGGLKENKSLCALALDLGVGDTDATALTVGLEAMMGNRRRTNDQRVQDPTKPAPPLKLQKLVLVCSVHTSSSTEETTFTDVNPVMNLIGDATAVPLQKLRIVFTSIPNSIQQSLALAVRGAPCLEELVVEGPPLDNLDEVEPELVNAIKFSNTIHMIAIGGEALNYARGLRLGTSRATVRNDLFRNKLGWDRVYTDPRPIVDLLLDALRFPGQDILGSKQTEAITGNIHGYLNENEHQDDDYSVDEDTDDEHENVNMNNDDNDDNDDDDNDDPGRFPRDVIENCIGDTTIEDEGQEAARNLLNEILELFPRVDETTQSIGAGPTGNFNRFGNDGNDADDAEEDDDNDAVILSTPLGV